ncbi:imidazole glycerol phosphate synthase, glutamine amidotransferase subunit [Rubidibacter lacunae KORDI 51-2]|uniref:Imidazole glycerol phosphate synthase subunit HisH n=1 Tax=Rubidibacter lacunae KORDI 51-2 TaxID=582515 RepID=U5D653_9CHRO|nr:imidazole glycerol phosphate synthase subunit HisH [Rubidibacter lacunae]ERN40108.1 imidazole glycerol phosphate synthase, glutamine amidotransferase subunit [Rubidibacter lacunae KORDI 51-2]
MPTIAVIDYDMGNLHSACKGLERAGAMPQVTADAEVILHADAVVLPGVGSFDPAARRLRERDLEQPIKAAIASGKPFLGICLGMQVLCDSSEEGNEPGLGIVTGTVRHFHPEPGIAIPHMGWNALNLVQPQHPLWRDMPLHPQMYFVHSYYVAPQDPQQVDAATVTHGTQTVTAAIAIDNVMAAQFHPEKSSHAGLQLLANFVSLVRSPVTI